MIYNLCQAKINTDAVRDIKDPTTPFHHMRIYKHTIETFVEKSQQIHGNKYSYKLVEYQNNKIAINIICNFHKKIFSQRPYAHLKGQGCPFCRNDNNINMNNVKQNIAKQTFIKKSLEVTFYKSVHYDYSKSIYIDNRTKLEIICPIHGSFWQKPNDHLCGHGCEKCGAGSKYSTQDFITKAKKVLLHQDKNYDYSKVNYVNNYTKVKIICPNHHEFDQTPNAHLLGKGCRFCKSSKGEMLIQSYFEKNNIIFQKQKTFINCKNIKVLPFDFAIYNENDLLGVVEYQGKQHFKVWGNINDEKHIKQFKISQLRDQIKRNYCTVNNIPLLEIPYTKINDIENIITDFIEVIKKRDELNPVSHSKYC